MNLNKENLLCYLEGVCDHLEFLLKDSDDKYLSGAFKYTKNVINSIESGIFDVEETESEKYLKLYIENLAKELKGE